MGVTVLDQVVSRLLADGWPPETPAAIVERGTLAWERQISGPLYRLGELAQAHVASPALVVVGEAAENYGDPRSAYDSLHRLGFYELSDVGKRFALACPSGCSRPGRPKLLPRTFASLSRGDVDWVVFTDKLAVKTFWTAAAEHRLDAHVMRSTKIAALETETARRLEQYYLAADVVITEKDVHRTAIRLGKLSQKGVLVVQGSHTPRGLCSQLEEAGAAVNHLALHRLVTHPELGRRLPDHNVIYFVSPAGVHAYAKTYGKEAFQREVWCLGKATQKA